MCQLPLAFSNWTFSSNQIFLFYKGGRTAKIFLRPWYRRRPRSLSCIETRKPVLRDGCGLLINGANDAGWQNQVCFSSCSSKQAQRQGRWQMCEQRFARPLISAGSHFSLRLAPCQIQKGVIALFLTTYK